MNVNDLDVPLVFWMINVAVHSIRTEKNSNVILFVYLKKHVCFFEVVLNVFKIQSWTDAFVSLQKQVFIFYLI